jgi:hypothetical protein
MTLRMIKDDPRVPLASAFEQRIHVGPDSAIAEGGMSRFRLDKAGVCTRLNVRVMLTVDVTNAGAGPTGTVRPWNPTQFLRSVTVKSHGEQIARYDGVSGELAYIYATLMAGGQAPWYDALTQAEARAIGTYAVGFDLPILFSNKDGAPYAMGSLLMERSDDVTVDLQWGTINDLVDNRGAGFAATVVGTAYLTQFYSRNEFDRAGYGALRLGADTHDTTLAAGDNKRSLTALKIHRALLLVCKTTATTVPVFSDAVLTNLKIDQGGGKILYDCLAPDIRNMMIADFGLPVAGPRADSSWTGIYLVDPGKREPHRPSPLSAYWNSEGKPQVNATFTMAAGLVVPRIEVMEVTIEGLYL